MSLIGIKRRGQLSAPLRPAQRWLDRKLVYADALTTYPANEITGQADTVTGTKIVSTPWGLARGFGSTVGGGTTDKVQTSLLTHPVQRTYILRCRINGAGGNSLGRLFASTSNHQAFRDNSLSTITYERPWTSALASWRCATPANNVPFVFALSYDASSTANVPRMYIDGASKTVSIGQAPVGALTALSEPFSIGNNPTGIRNWDGLLSDFLVFDSILTDGEIAELADPIRIWQERKIWVPVSAGGAISGNLSVTLGSAALASAGTVEIAGALSKTLGDATLASASTLSLAGTLSSTLGAATLTSAGALDISGSLASTLGNATLSSTGTVEIAGSASITLAGATLSSASAIDINASLSSALADATLASDATLALTGDLSSQLGDATLSSAGSTGATGSVDVTLEGATLASASTLEIQGSTSVTLGDATLSSSAQLYLAGALDVTLGAATLSSSGVLSDPGTGQLAVTLENASLAATGALDIAGSVDKALGNATLNSAGRVDIAAALGITLGDCTLSATGIEPQPITGQLAVTLGDATLRAKGNGPNRINAAIIGNNKRAEDRKLAFEEAAHAASAVVALIIAGAFDQ